MICGRPFDTLPPEADSASLADGEGQPWLRHHRKEVRTGEDMSKVAPCPPAGNTIDSPGFLRKVADAPLAYRNDGGVQAPEPTGRGRAESHQSRKWQSHKEILSNE